MLQFIARKSDKYSVAEQVQMALEGGCQWIQVDMGTSPIEEARQELMEIIPLCQEVGAFLVLEHNVELVAELKIHGVHLSSTDMPATEAREVLGPEAVIGVSVTSASDILSYRGIDVDYAQLRPGGLPCHRAIEGIAPIVLEASQGGNELPIVAVGGVRLEDITALKFAGVNGVAIGSAIIDADDPVDYTAKILSALS